MPYRKRWIASNSKLAQIEKAFIECILTPLGLARSSTGLDIVVAPPEKESFDAKRKREKETKVGRIRNIGCCAHDPSDLPVVDLDVSIYDKDLEAKFDALVPVMLERCRQGDFGGEKFEVDFDLIVKH